MNPLPLLAGSGVEGGNSLPSGASERGTPVAKGVISLWGIYFRRGKDDDKASSDDSRV